jgi:iron(II)-dependent oxidoreductase
MSVGTRMGAGAHPEAGGLDRRALATWYERNRTRSSLLFEMLTDDAYFSRPIALRHPIVFYEGHLPAFSFNTLVKRGLGGESIDARLEQLFARGIDPHESQGADGDPEALARLWPDRHTVRQFAAEADRRVLLALAHGDIEQPGHPLLHRAEAAYCILEHEAMHHETMLYMWHRVPYDQKRRPLGYWPPTNGEIPEADWITVPPGDAEVGVDAAAERFTWDNERPSMVMPVPAFRIERHDVSNQAFMAFVEAGGYRDDRWWTPRDWAWRAEHRIDHPPFWERDGGRWWWRGMFDRVRLPLAWPVYVSHAEASAYARWRGCRLPTEAEYHRAAFGTPSGAARRYPWGAEAPTARHGVFDLAQWEPRAVDSHPAGDSAWGVADLMGNGWEWTSTVFAPFPGFAPLPSYPEYSADFFDGEHYVLKGASPATAAELLRPSFRNWFRPRYPFVYATFRCVAEQAP